MMRVDISHASVSPKLKIHTCTLQTLADMTNSVAIHNQACLLLYIVIFSKVVQACSTLPFRARLCKIAASRNCKLEAFHREQ